MPVYDRDDLVSAFDGAVNSCLQNTVVPDEIIVVGGHLDSWDLGDGAHDDGAVIVQSMEVLHL